MAIVVTRAPRIRGIVSSVPPRRFDNLNDASAFDRAEVEKVVRMAGVRARHLADDSICSSDLCVAAGKRLLEKLGWEPSSVDALLFVTQTPDYFLPSTCCVAHQKLGLGDHCASFDIGLGCSGYPYGLSTAAMMLQSPGIRRALVLHGETPTRFSDNTDRAVALLFGLVAAFFPIATAITLVVLWVSTPCWTASPPPSWPSVRCPASPAAS